MIIKKENRKQLIDFLINRWQLMIGLSAFERVYFATCEFAEKNKQPKPEMSPIIEHKPSLQIVIIKKRIIEILPDVKFIDYNYESPTPLNANDFVEVYCSDHQQCISKIKEVMEKLQIK